MGLGTKNRQKQTAEICKQHLREKYRDQLGLVEEFIVEIEGIPKNCDVTRWGQFTDIKDIKKEMFKRLEVHFENWLNPWAFFVRTYPANSWPYSQTLYCICADERSGDPAARFAARRPLALIATLIPNGPTTSSELSSGSTCRRIRYRMFSQPGGLWAC